MPLAPGSYCFGPSTEHRGGLGAGDPDAVSFKLRIDESGSVEVTRGTEPLAVEGSPVAEAASIDSHQAIQLVTDHFFVDRLRPDPASPSSDGAPAPGLGSGLDERFALRLFGGLIALGAVGALVDLRFLILSVLGALGWAANRLLRHRMSAPSAAPLTTSRPGVADPRRLATDAARNAVPSASTVDAVSTGAAGWSFDGRISLASGDRAWAPGEGTDSTATGDHFLPAVPFAVDLWNQSIAIVGPRPAQLAVARHLLTAVLVLDDHSSVEVRATPDTDDWSWFRPRSLDSDHTVTLIDGVGADLDDLASIGPGSIVLPRTSDVDADIVLTLSPDGTASARLADGSEATGLVPHGITVSQATRVLARRDTSSAQRASSRNTMVTNSQVIDLRHDDLPPIGTEVYATPRLFVAGDEDRSSLAVLASSAIVQAQAHGRRPIYIIDRGDRALIRLAQIPTCRRYAAIDDIEAIEAIVDDLETLAGGAVGDDRPAMVVFRDLLHGLDFLERAGFGHLSERLHRLLRRSNPIDAAVSQPNGGPSGPSGADGLMEQFLVWIHPPADSTSNPIIVADEQGRHVLDLRDVPGRDLTGAVALARVSRAGVHR